MLLTVTAHVRLPDTKNVANFLFRTHPLTSVHFSLPEFVSAHYGFVAYSNRKQFITMRTPTVVPGIKYV